MIRAFLAVELGETLRHQIASFQQDLRQRLSQEVSNKVRISWVPPNSIHLTIKFLGAIDEEIVSPLHNALASVVQCHTSLLIPIEQLGAFPTLQQPRVLWAGPSDRWMKGSDGRRLTLLHQAVEAGCRSCGLAPEDRPWSPHLTVARIKGGARQLGLGLVKIGQMDRLFALGPLEVESVVLMKSELLPSGAIYTKQWEIG